MNIWVVVIGMLIWFVVLPVMIVVLLLRIVKPVPIPPPEQPVRNVVIIGSVEDRLNQMGEQVDQIWATECACAPRCISIAGKVCGMCKPEYREQLSVPRFD